MKMPIDEIEAVYNRYKEESSKLNKNADEFFAKMNEFDLLKEDSNYDMIRKTKDVNTVSVSDFIKNN